MAAHGRLALHIEACLQLVRHILQHFDIGDDALRLDRMAGRRKIARGGECQRTVAGAERNNRLYRALAERAGPDEGRALVIVQCTGHDLRSRCRSAVDQHDKRLALDEIAGSRREALGLLCGSASRRDNLAPRHERARHGDRLIEQSAGIIAQVDHVASQLFRRDLFRNVGDRFFQSVGCLFVEGGDLDIADIATVGVVADRAHANDFAHNRNFDRCLRALADDLESGLRADRPLHLAHSLLQGEPFHCFAIDVGDQVA